jgi:hypothetical protein
MDKCFNTECKSNEDGICLHWGISQPALQCRDYENEDEDEDE